MENIQFMPVNPVVIQEMQANKSGTSENAKSFSGLMSALFPGQILPELGEKKPGKISMEDLQQLMAMQQLAAGGYMPQQLTDVLQPVSEEQTVKAAKLVNPVQIPGNAPTAETTIPMAATQDSGTAQMPAEARSGENSQPVPGNTAPELLSEKADVKPAVTTEPAAYAAQPMNAEKQAVCHGLRTENSPENNKLPETIRPEDTELTAEEKPLFVQVETAPVKVSETADTSKAHQTLPVAHQVMDKLKQAVELGERKLEIQLTPRNLGKLRVELTQKENGQIHISLYAEREEVRALLERSLPEMQQMLKSASQENYQDVQIHVPEQKQEQFYQDAHQNQQNRQNQQEDTPKRESSQDFLNRLRLGLAPVEEAVS